MSSSPGDGGGQKRPVRPNFAEDVYGEKESGSTGTQSEEQASEFSDSSLAQRRHWLQVSLLKLKNLKDASSGPGTSNDPPPLPEPHPPTEAPDITDKDLTFEYSECDALATEMAELYSYSEMEDFSSNYQCWKNYADKNQIDFCFFTLPQEKKLSIVRDLCNRLESAESDMRLASSRIFLYLLQGAFGDFSDEEEVEAGVPTQAPMDKGTGGYEVDCLVRAFHNAHLVYSCGGYQALCTLLLTEIVEPFDCGGLPLDGRISKASSRDSRHASNADLSDHEKRRRMATMADNESIRVVLASIYHMVELIRNLELTENEGNVSTMKQREQFLQELEEPLDNHGEPLIYVLFEMMPPFYNGNSPHFPMKKVLLLVWKILLATLGGWKKLAIGKQEVRSSRELPLFEDTITVAERLPATVIANDAENCARMSAKRTLAFARQMATSSSEDEKDDKDETATLTSQTSVESDKRSNSSRQTSGDQTPRAGSPCVMEPPKKLLPWKSKVSKKEVEAFVQQERQKFFNYQLPGDITSTFGFPPSILNSINILKSHIYTSVGEIQAEEDEEFNRYLFSRKEEIKETGAEKLYRMLLPNLSQYIVALLKVLLASAPSNKAKNDALNILVDVLTPETDGCDFLSNSISLDNSTSNPLEESVRLTIDINRHKEILVKATSSILILLIKHFKQNHIYQFEYLCQHVVFGNGIPLLLKFLDQNMQRYVQSRHEIFAYNYPQAALHYVRNREEWPTLNADNVEESPENKEVYFLWRNVFSSLNLVRVLNKLVKNRQSRIMMLMVFKSAPILKRSLKIRLGIFQLYVLKLLKMQSRYLGRQWRRANMDIMSAIYNKVRHRLTDDWAFANEMRKSYDCQNEENELKAAVERFHSRRYSQLYPQLAIEVTDDPMPGDDYLNRVNMREYEPVDSCLHSVLGYQPPLGPRFTKHYKNWLKREVYNSQIDWDKLLFRTRGLYGETEA